MPDLFIIKELCVILGISITSLLNGEETSDEKVILRLLWLLEKFKQLRYVLIGSTICYFSNVVKSLSFINLIQAKTFIKGFIDGAAEWLKIFGVFIFVYGFASYIRKNLELKNNL